MSYSSIITPYINENNESFEPVPRGFVRIGADLNASRTMRDKNNQRKRAGKTVMRVAWFYIGAGVEIAQWADKEGVFHFGDGYLDIPRYKAQKMGILGDYMSVITSEGTFSKKEQNEMSKPHGVSCRCFGDRCVIPF